MRPFYEDLPAHISSLVDEIRRDRDSPSPALDQLLLDTDLYDLEMGATKGEVESYCLTEIFPDPKLSGSLKLCLRLPHEQTCHSQYRTAIPSEQPGTRHALWV